MKHTRFVMSAVRKVFLALSGLIAAGIAVAIWTVPDAFYGSYGIDLGGDVNLINELKAPAGVLFVAGLAILAGAFRARYTSMSMKVAAILYLSFGVSRIASFVIDGMPGESIVSAALLEILIGAIALFGLLAQQRKSAI